jgi:hypothetical protein
VHGQGYGIHCIVPVCSPRYIQHVTFIERIRDDHGLVSRARDVWTLTIVPIFSRFLTPHPFVRFLHFFCSVTIARD